MGAREVSFVKLFSTFTKELAHKLRTPLSVISNELFYIQASHPTIETNAALAKCQELSSLLSEAATFWETWPQDREQFLQCIEHYLQDFFHLSNLQARGAGSSQIVFSADSINVAGGSGRYQSFTEFSRALQTNDLLLPIFLDIIVEAHEAKLEIEVASITTIGLKFS